jgi:hypothetical protein
MVLEVGRSKSMAQASGQGSVLYHKAVGSITWGDEQWWQRELV